MSRYRAAAATPASYELAEGVLWDAAAHAIRWVDINEGRVLAGRLNDGTIDRISAVALGQTAGAVALAADGGLLVAGARCLVTISTEGTISYGPDLLGDRQGVRFNDGSVDAFGALVVGTLALGEPTGNEQLLRVSPDGHTEILRDGIHLSNGIAFSPDGDTIYHVDTFAGTISRHSYGPGPFVRDEPWVTVLDDLPHYPDGLTVDSEGHLWVAQWGGSCVLRYSAAGELLDTVEVDAEQVSCPAFVGPDLDILAITTAQEDLAHFTDQAGALFLADVPAQGLAAHLWAGSTTEPYWLHPNRNESVE